MDVLKKFAAYYKPYKKFFFLDLFCATIISAVDLAFPQILRRAASDWFTWGQEAILRSLPLLFAGLLVLYVIQTLCKYYVTYQGHLMGTWIERDMRRDLFDHYEKLSFSYYDKNNTGQMMSKLVSDLFEISEFAHHGPENVFISSIKIAGSFVFLFPINGKLALLLAVVVLLMVLFCCRQNARMHETFMDNRRKIGDINASLQDTLSGIRVVQSFANEEIERKKFGRSNENFVRSRDNNYRAMGKFHAGTLFFQGMMYLTVLVAGGYLISIGEMEPADLAMYALYIGIFISPIQILVEFTEMLQKGLTGFKRFLAVMETEPEIEDAPDAKPLTNVQGHISYEDVSFCYNSSEPVLSHVSFSIPAGRSIALVGPSGGGKTTICSLLPRFYDVTHGRIAIDGQDIRKTTLKSLRSSIGLVQQEVYLFGGTIRENIAYGKPGATDEEIIAAAKRPASTISSWSFPTATTPLWASGAQGFPAARSNGSPLPGYSLKIRLSRSWMRPPAPWTMKVNATSRKAWRSSPETAPPSPSPTVSPPSGMPTRSSSSTARASLSVEATKSSWKRTVCMPDIMKCSLRAWRRPSLPP